jgi:hypothetical protein
VSSTLAVRPDSTELDGGQTTEENLALCCALCNRYKGSDIASIDPETGLLTPLFHPRLDRCGERFEFRSGEIMGLTAAGQKPDPTWAQGS